MDASPLRDSSDALSPVSLCLVNDDPTQLMVQKRLLSQVAHVVGFLSPVEALAAARVGLAPPLLVTDFHMPCLSGPELAKAWCHLYPEARVLVISASEVSAQERAFVEELPREAVRLLTSYRIVELQKHIQQWFQDQPDLPELPSPAASTESRLDPTVLHKLAKLGGGAFVAKTIARFLQGAPEKVEAISAAVSRGDHTSTHGLAHALKGSCGLVGAVSLSVVADKIESATEQNGSHQELPAYIEELLAESRATLSELESFSL